LMFGGGKKGCGVCILWGRWWCGKGWNVVFREGGEKKKKNGGKFYSKLREGVGRD